MSDLGFSSSLLSPHLPFQSTNWHTLKTELCKLYNEGLKVLLPLSPRCYWTHLYQNKLAEKLHSKNTF